MVKQPSELALKLAGRLEARAKVKPAEQAALAYARWKGMTDEVGLDRQAQKAKLDELVDAIEPEQWLELQQAAAGIADRALKGVLLYSIERSRAQTQEFVQIHTDQMTPDERAETTASGQHPAKSRVKSKDRSK